MSSSRRRGGSSRRDGGRNTRRIGGSPQHPAAELPAGIIRAPKLALFPISLTKTPLSYLSASTTFRISGMAPFHSRAP